MDELIIIIFIVILCVSVFAGWLASVACCPDQAMACLGNDSKKNQNFQRKDEKSVNRRKMTDSSEYGYNELQEMNGNTVIDEENSDKGENAGSENDQTRLIKKEELLKYTQKHSQRNGSSLGIMEDGDSQMVKPHLVKKHESTDVIEYAIVDYNAFVAAAAIEKDDISPITTNDSGDIVVEDDSDLLVSCALEDSRDNITESINYPYKFQEHHLSLLTYDPMKRRESLPMPINHNRLSPTRDVIKAV